MKHRLLFITLFSASILIIPAVPAAFSGRMKASAEPQSSRQESEKPVDTTDASAYRVLDVSSGQVIEVPVRDYIIGAVCAEMPATFDCEALKAQAAAAHTYAERQRLREKASPTPELCGADFSNDTSKYQGYFTVNQAKQYYGEAFEQSYKKIADAVDEVADFIITYNDEPIISAFHSMSPGMTESAENAWGTAVDYLVPVESDADTSAPKYLEETVYQRDVLREKLSSAFGAADLGDNMEEWVKVTGTSESGTVLTASVGGIIVSGSDIRSALALRSPCFTVKSEGDSMTFTTKGYGHGVGMSQYGANSMALNGSTWEEILAHYYVGCSIVRCSDVLS